MKIFALLAALGLALSTAAYSSTLLGVDPFLFPYVWLLHIGIFVMLIPAMVALPGNREGRAFRWRDVMGDAPAWLHWLAVLLVAHAFINTAARELVWGSGGPTREADCTYSLSNHGRIIRPITAAEYQRARGYEFRSFSCWWMLFYWRC